MAKKRTKKRKRKQGAKKRPTGFELTVQWVRSYDGPNIIEAYAERFGVSSATAIRDLKHLGAKLDSGEVVGLRAKPWNKRVRWDPPFESHRDELKGEGIERNEDYAHILGFTPEGKPYGVPWQEADKYEEDPFEWVRKTEKARGSMMHRYHYLAAEMFGYSYANYENHLGIGHLRYELLMPFDTKTLERAANEEWPTSRLAKELGVDEAQARQNAQAFKEAVAVVDSENPTLAFRNGVRQSIEQAVKEGLKKPDEIEMLVSQICYRAADMACLLDREGEDLSTYSQDLRWERCVEFLASK